MTSSPIDIGDFEENTPTTIIIRAQFASVERFRALFFSSKRYRALDEYAKIVGIRSKSVAGLDIVRTAPRGLEIDALHSPTRDIDEQCTVFCPNGKSLTGFHPCITCEDDDGFVRVCC